MPDNVIGGLGSIILFDVVVLQGSLTGLRYPALGFDHNV